MQQEQIDLERHSLAHLMAAAVLELWPKARFGIGPVVENGFYYDIEIPGYNLVEEDLKKIQNKMLELKKKKLDFVRQEMEIDEAIKIFEKLGQTYKVELLNDLKTKGTTKMDETETEVMPKGSSKISLYQTGDFIDLCRGPHVKNSSDIKSIFKLERLAGAYWRGDEKNKMLTRIYGLAFADKKQLSDYLTMMEEAKKRDHRKLGKELEIFTFSEDIGPGLPIWLPNGTVLRDELENLAKEKEFEYGYQRVSTPVITKEDLFYTSGHLPHYQDSMYSPMEIDGENYYIKPMNCPFHHSIFQSKPRSYRELPIRYTEYGLCHRYEKSGELQGLMRVRSLMMNDAHIYVRPDQVKEELKRVLEMHQYYYDLFGIKKVTYRLSLHNPDDLGGKYIDMPKEWKENEQILREVLQEMKLDFVEAENEASFYGPKIDINIFSAIGKEYTVGTTQLDFAQPKKFDLKYIDEKGQEIMPFCIHRAPLSTHERFIGFLIEHYAGNFPLWLSPIQVKIISVGSDHKNFCQKLADKLKAKRIRVEADLANETVGNKIRKASNEKIPYTLVIGDKEINSDKLAVRVRGNEKLWDVKYEDFVKKLESLITGRSAEL